MVCWLSGGYLGGCRGKDMLCFILLGWMLGGFFVAFAVRWWLGACFLLAAGAGACFYCCGAVCCCFLFCAAGVEERVVLLLGRGHMSFCCWDGLGVLCCVEAVTFLLLGPEMGIHSLAGLPRCNAQQENEGSIRVPWSSRFKPVLTQRAPGRSSACCGHFRISCKVLF